MFLFPHELRWSDFLHGSHEKLSRKTSCYKIFIEIISKRKNELEKHKSFLSQHQMLISFRNDVGGEIRDEQRE